MDESKNDRSSKANLVFTGCCILGVGIGYFVKNIAGGAVVGVGIGFLMRGYFAKN